MMDDLVRSPRLRPGDRVRLVDAGELDEGDSAAFVATIHDAARRGLCSMSLTMHGVVAQ